MKKITKPSSSLEDGKLKTKMKEIMNISDEASSSRYSSSSTLSPNSTKRVSRVALRLRNPMVRLRVVQRSIRKRQAEALALPLGMSFAGLTYLVLERSGARRNVNVDDLAVISASTVEESLANVYGDKLGSFATNFKTSFKSTLKILQLTNESTFTHQTNNNNVASFNEVIQDGERKTFLTNDIVLHEETRQPSRSSGMSLTTIERSLEEQARANDLKSVEIGLTMRKLKLKETELSLSYELNNLEITKLEMGVSKAAFKAEKFKNELLDKRKTEMVTKLMDWLILNVFTMLGAMSYGAYVFAKQGIQEANSICKLSEEETSPWWVPELVLWLNTKYIIWICQVQVWIHTILGGLMIMVLTYFMIRNSSVTKQTMPVSYIVLFLGLFCGFMGKFCVDTLGGNGRLWLFIWGMYCLLQLVANSFALALYGLINGSIRVTQATKSSRCSTMVPYWARSFFLGVIMFVIPLINGLLPFATFGEWRDHFVVLVSLWWDCEV